MGGGPRGRNVISTEGNARALHFSPAPTGLRSGQFSRHSEKARKPGLGPVLGFSLCLYFRHPSISDGKKLPRWWKQHEGSTVFRVPQQQRAVSAAEDFCFKYMGSGKKDGLGNAIAISTEGDIPRYPPPEGRRARVNMLSRGPRIRSGAPGPRS